MSLQCFFFLFSILLFAVDNININSLSRCPFSLSLSFTRSSFRHPNRLHRFSFLFRVFNLVLIITYLVNESQLMHGARVRLHVTHCQDKVHIRENSVEVFLPTFLFRLIFVFCVWLNRHLDSIGIFQSSGSDTNDENPM